MFFNGVNKNDFEKLVKRIESLEQRFEELQRVQLQLAQIMQEQFAQMRRSRTIKLKVYNN